MKTFMNAATTQKAISCVYRSYWVCSVRPSGAVSRRTTACLALDTSKPAPAERLTAAPPSLEMVQATSVLSSVPTVGYLAAFLVLFSLISYDITNPSSPHLLQSVDLAVHNNVMDFVPLAFRSTIADKVISNAPIGLSALAIVVGLQLLITTHFKRGLFLGGLLGAFNFLFGGIGFGLDAQATAALKNFFQRARPSSDLHSSFSFPSGHSTSVYFFAGFLFFIIVPAVYETLREDAQQSAPESIGPASGTAGNRALEALEVIVRPPVAAALTVAFGSTTQAGRILADVHWTSDVIAGMLWGSCGVAMALIVQDVVYKLAGMQTSSESEEAMKSSGNSKNGVGRPHDE